MLTSAETRSKTPRGKIFNTLVSKIMPKFEDLQAITNVLEAQPPMSRRTAIKITAMGFAVVACDSTNPVSSEQPTSTEAPQISKYSINDIVNNAIPLPLGSHIQIKRDPNTGINITANIDDSGSFIPYNFTFTSGGQNSQTETATQFQLAESSPGKETPISLPFLANQDLSSQFREI